MKHLLYIFLSIALLQSIAADAQPNYSYNYNTGRKATYGDSLGYTYIKGAIRVRSYGFGMVDSFAVDTTVIATKQWVRDTLSAAGSIDVDGLTDLYMVAGVIRPVRDTATGINTWQIIDDADHSAINIDSVASDGNSVYVFFKDTCTEIMTFLAAPDESMIQPNGNSKVTPPATTTKDGGYKIGSRVFTHYAQVYFSKPFNNSLQIIWNGSSFTINNVGNAYNINSPVLDVTYSSGRIRIKTTSTALFKGFPRITGMSANGSSTLMYVPFMDYIGSTWIDIYFWDLSTGTKLTAATCPTDLAFTFDLGTMDGIINPTTTDFGPNANFWCIGMLKK